MAVIVFQPSLNLYIEKDITLITTMKLNTFFLLIALAFAGNNIAFAQQETEARKIVHFYIVRHAEKDTGRNPGLLAIGQTRAGDLHRLLKDKEVDEIYVTQTKRSMMTADSVKFYRNLKTVVYDADTTGHGLLYKMNQGNGFQKNLLIIAHSNTIPGIIRSLGIKDFKNAIPDSEHDKLYIIRQKKEDVSMKIQDYGKPSDKLPTDKMKSLQ